MTTPVYTDKRAVVSPCGRYRYALWRRWPRRGPAQGPVLFLMLNPSTADGLKDDPTVRRCVSLAYAWGQDEICIANLFAWRSPHPKDIPQNPAHARGPERDAHLVKWPGGLLWNSVLTVAAWGNSGGEMARVEAGRVCRLIKEHWPARPIYCLGTTQSGAPKHPLARGKHRIPDDQQPVAWEGYERSRH